MGLNIQTKNPVLIVKAMQGEDVIGYVVLDSIINGRSYGGLRMLTDVDDAQLRDAAHTMTLKYSFLGLARGGAKAGIRGDPEAPESQRKKKLRAFGQAIAPLLQNKMYIPYVDMGTDDHDILDMLTASGVRIKPSKREKPDSGYYTAVSVKACADRAARNLGLKLSRCNVAIEGFGKVGAPLAAMMSEAGARVVAVSTLRGAIFSSQGLDIPRLIHMAHQSGSRVVETYREAERIDKSELLELPVDLLLPCAEPYSLHEGNRDLVQASEA
jgi:glutamate dehydrogenase (NAD(P)+)